ncbi:MAG TPA: SDR family NAD(P)-dependent oxidoreductase, partial [Nevskiaceae bacterium]|nr:SDR family NAD(P)-dependent oxidoreductase [Nevskiaceae bacterium]
MTDYGKQFRLDGKAALVTGAARGIGAEVALALAGSGAAVLVSDIADSAGRETVERIRKAGGRAEFVHHEVTSEPQWEAAIALAVKTYGKLDVLVNNAGILRDATLWKMSDADFDAVLTTHLRGTFTCTRAAAVHMRGRGGGGRIICVGSPTGQLGNFGQTNYAAA